MSRRPIFFAQPIFLCFVVTAGILFFLPRDAQAQAIGEQRLFFVSQDFDRFSRTQVQATLKSVSVNALAYVEDAYLQTLSQPQSQSFFLNLDALLQEFDTTIYPKLSAFLGKPWEPGIDNDPRIRILFSQLGQSFGGYVNTADEFPKSEVATSNEAELIYFNAIHVGDLRAKAFVAHEFQHLITFNLKERGSTTKEDIWLNELRSEYAPTYLGYDDVFGGSNLADRVQVFLSNPSDSLTEWNGDAADYGSVNLLGQYLADRLGAAFFPETLGRNTPGIQSIEETLDLLLAEDDFATAVLSWHVANWLNNSFLDDGKWGYRNPTLGPQNFRLATPTEEFSLLQNVSARTTRTVDDWAGYWFRFIPQGIGGSKALSLSLEGLGANSAPNAALVIERLNGTVEVRTVPFIEKKAQEIVVGFGSAVSSVVTVFLNTFQKESFTDTPLSAQVDIRASIVEAPRVSINDVTPRKVFTMDREILTVYGEGFSSDMTVEVDGASVPVTFVDDAMVTFRAPLHGAGPACMTFLLPEGTGATRCDLLSFIDRLSEGELVQTANDPRVWVIKGTWRRHILAPEIFSFYGHLSWQNVRTISKEELARYSEGPWIRAAGDPRVFEINGDGTRHWLNMTAEEFVASGRSWDGVFIINAQERDFYTAGADVLFR